MYVHLLGTWGVFGMRVVFPIDISTYATVRRLLCPYEEIQGRLKKIEGADYEFSIWGGTLENLRENPDL